MARGSKEVPDSVPDALAGLAFVFTGELSSFSRDEAVDLAKRLGGFVDLFSVLRILFSNRHPYFSRVVGQPSSKTDFVVLGDNAGPSKLAAIKKHHLQTLNEDEFLNLIATRKGLGNGKADDKTKKKMEKEHAAIRQAAKELENREEKGAAAKKDGRLVVFASSVPQKYR